MANAAADAVTPEAIGALRAKIAASARPADDLERQEEILEGLEQLLIVSSAPLPVVETQHRVIGADVCHFVAPANLIGQVDTPGKVFITAQRLVFAGGRVHAWPWHRVRTLVRVERTLVVTALGAPEDVHLGCNSYGDAMVAAYLANLARRRET